MKHIKSLFYVVVILMVFVSCETQNNIDADATESDDASKGEAVFKAELSYKGEVYHFNLSGDELTDKVTFLNSQLYFKATNNQQQVLHIKLASPDLYSSTSGVFTATPNLPFQIKESLAAINFYNPNEQAVTNSSTKYLIDDEVVVSKLAESSIILAYDGDAITGAQLNNTDEGRFNLSLELSYSNFEIQDLR